jgi:hypothetical protein
MLYRGVLVRQGIIDGSRIEESTERLSTQGWDGLFFLYKLVLLEFWYQTVVAGRPVEQLNP